MFPTVDTEDISQVTPVNSSNSCSSRHETQSAENSQVAKQSNNRELTLNMLIKELVFCIALALTTYGALHNTPTKVSKHPQAGKFFSEDSLVTDWYRGQLSQALDVINTADVSFVMYYAPWDAESQYVRKEFEKAASVLSDKVHFSAINCWNPGSECRIHHNKIPSWPILMVYTVTSRGVLYKGPRDAHNMVKFLSLIIKPLERISTTGDLVNLLSICDAVAVGYTPLTESSKLYNVWYNVAIKAKELDTVGEICFAVVLSEELAFELGVDSVPTAKLMLWNDTKEYVVNENGSLSWNESSLTQWVLHNFSQPVARIIPMWKKAFSFDQYIDGNPLLILFTPLNPLYDQMPAYSLLREVAMEYYNCKDNKSSLWTSELIKLQQAQRQLYQQKDFMKFCHNFKFKKPLKKRTSLYKKEIISRNNKYPWNNNTQKNYKSGFFDFVKQGLPLTGTLKTSGDESMLFPLDLIEECYKKVLPAEKSYYDNYDQCQTIEKKLMEEQDEIYDDEMETTMLPFEDDPLSPENLVQDSVKNFCKLIKFAHEREAPVYPGKVPLENITQLHGLACRKNFTIHMLAVDSVRNHHFAEALGIDVVNKKDNTAVIILDSKHENQYVLKEDYNEASLREFIYNFTHGKLKRTLRTRVEEASHTHFFGSNGDESISDDNSIEVIDLTTKTFRRIVRANGTVTLVGVCSVSCGAHVTRALLAAARLLRACGVRVRAGRLDAAQHDLPWHLTAHQRPNVLVFKPTRNGDADSVAYPSHARISTSGLVALALKSLGPPENLRVRIALCARSKANIEKKTCLKDTRENVSTMIERNLKYWRRTDVRGLKDALLRRLQHLHQISLQLSLLHHTELKQNHKLKTLQYSLTNLSNSWEIDLSMLSKNDLSTKS